MTFEPSVKKSTDMEAPVISPEEMARLALEAYAELKASKRPPDDPGLTSYELAELWGCSHSMTKKRLLKLKQAGLVIVGKRYMLTKAGGWQGQPVYLLKVKDERIR